MVTKNGVIAFVAVVALVLSSVSLAISTKGSLKPQTSKADMWDSFNQCSEMAQQMANLQSAIRNVEGTGSTSNIGDVLVNEHVMIESWYVQDDCDRVSDLF